jgi:hypothetical protein
VCLIRRWLTHPTAQPQDTYAVDYADYFEPYVIIARDRFLPYDERFRGYGMNKCVHLRGLHQCHLGFYVLCGAFAVARAHDKSDSRSLLCKEKAAFRRYIVATIYERAVEEMSSVALVCPPISSTTMTLMHHGSTPLAVKSLFMAGCPSGPTEGEEEEEGMRPLLQKFIAGVKRKGVVPILSSLKHLSQGNISGGFMGALTN